MGFAFALFNIFIIFPTTGVKAKGILVQEQTSSYIESGPHSWFKMLLLVG